MAYTVNGIFFSFKKEGNSNIPQHEINFRDIILNEINQTEEEKYHIISLT